MELNRHYQCLDGEHIHRKLFLCRECLRYCEPNTYVPYQEHHIYKIATAYGCDRCDVNWGIVSDGEGACYVVP